MMGERHGLQTRNENSDSGRMEIKRGFDVIEGTSSSYAKKIKTDGRVMLEVERSSAEEKFMNVSSGDVDLDRGNNTSQDTNNLVTNQESSTVAKEKTCSECQLTLVDAQIRNKQSEDNDILVENKLSSTDANKTQDGHHLTCVEADAAEDRGSRHTMEDAWVVLSDASLGIPGKLRCAHFAIYDGHGGRLAAEYARAHLHANILSAGLPRELMDIKAAKKAIIEGFRKTDEALLKESIAGAWQDGATAVCVWILGQMVLIANIGDAKAVLARSIINEGDHKNLDKTSCSLKAIVVTREHKAIYPQERARIQKAGGYVGPNGRLQGRLEVSRAFGDRQFKKVGVIATPDVHSFELTEREDFMILGCDGLWGVFGPSDAVEFVARQLKEGLSASVACRRLVREAVRERRCKDNCTAILIVFKHQ